MSAVATLPIKLTYEEYRTLPDDGQRYELIEGELFVFATPSIPHQLISARLLIRFDQVITPLALGWVLPAPVEVKFPGVNAVQPDLVVILRDRTHILTENRIEGAPNLVLEILSPSTRAYDLGTKAAFYARHGVPEYWVVDLVAATIVVHALRDGQYVALPGGDVARSRVVPDLTIDIRAIFAAASI